MEYMHFIRGVLMKDYIEERAVALANYIIENNATVRKAASVFHVSKSTVHKDVSQRLSKINKTLADKVHSVLLENKAERHIRGGLATKEKYLLKAAKKLQDEAKQYPERKYKYR